jgi:hypothetical protein
MTNNILVPIITDDALLFDPLIGGGSLLSVLETVIISVKEKLRYFAQSPDFQVKMELAFGQGIEIAQLQDAWERGEVVFPPIEIRPALEINGANGAFSAATNRIYLSREYLLQNAFDLQAIADVLLEEIGHYVDAQINEVDAPGDEGAIFAAVVKGENLSSQNLQLIKANNDTAIINLDGKLITIEQSLSENAPGTIFYHPNLSSEEIELLANIAEKAYKLISLQRKFHQDGR